MSTYLRALRATYNRAVDKHLAPYIPRLFKQVYTGTRADRKKALNIKDMSRILHSWDTDEIPHSLSRTHGLFILMFMLRGLPFVDLVNLHKKDLNGNIITYGHTVHNFNPRHKMAVHTYLAVFTNVYIRYR